MTHSVREIPEPSAKRDARPAATGRAEAACETPGLPRLRDAALAKDMDIERINQIGTRLADLIQRTEALRGYL